MLAFNFLLLSFAIGFVAYSPTVLRAAELYDMNRTSVRALGMGNAYTALVGDADSLFYNPAGLAREGGVHWRVFDLLLGAGNLEAYTKLQDLQDADSFSATLQELYGETLWTTAHAKTAITLPYVAGAFYGTFDSSIQISNAALPEMTAHLLYDTGIAVGVGAAVIPTLHMGMVLKRIVRKGMSKTYGSDVLAQLEPDEIIDDFDGSGLGYSMDLGVNFVAPAGPITPGLSFVWRNVGTTTFKATGDYDIPSDPDEMIVGAALAISTPVATVTPVFDYRYANRTDVQVSKKINFGIELDLPLVDLRAGYHQGYHTLGAGLSLGLFDIEAATYGVELGEYGGQKQDRRYVVQIKMDVGIDLGLGSSKSGSGSGSSSHSIFGRRLKQRR